MGTASQHSAHRDPHRPAGPEAAADVTGDEASNPTPMEAYRNGASVAELGALARNGKLDTSLSAMREDEVVPETDGSRLRTVARQMQRIQVIGATVIGAFMIIVVLSLVYGLDIVQNAEGPFGNLTSDYVDFAIAGLSLVGVGIVLLGANFAMGMFGFGGGGGR